MSRISNTSERAIPQRVVREVASAGTFISDGLPGDTWNGMTADTFTVGSRNGPREVHLLPAGVHPISVEEGKARFAWNETRALLWSRLEQVAERLADRGVTHVAGGGSYFSTDFANPGDIDLVAFQEPDGYSPRPDEAHPFARFNAAEGDHGIHAYASDFSIFFPGGPTSLWGFLHAPPNPRPPRPQLGGAKGPEVGLVLLDLAELRAKAAAQG